MEMQEQARRGHRVLSAWLAPVPPRTAALGAPSTEQGTDRLRLGLKSANFYLTKIWNHRFLFDKHRLINVRGAKRGSREGEEPRGASPSLIPQAALVRPGGGGGAGGEGGLTEAGFVPKVSHTHTHTSRFYL